MSEPSGVVTDFSRVTKQEFLVQGDTIQTTLTEGGSELIVSAYTADNSHVFPRVLNLHVDSGATIADVTWGTGVFWSDIDTAEYELYASDIDPEKSPSGYAVDCRNLPYADDSLDVVVIDPPYASGFFRDDKEKLAGGGSHKQFRESYSSGELLETRGSKYHQAVVDLYHEATEEASRVLNESGTLILKVQDEVSANTQELTHVQITNFLEETLGFYTKDLFVVVRSNTPAVSGMETQVHARKNHSFFMVYEV